MHDRTIKRIIGFRSTETAEKVADYLYHVTVEENYLTFSNYDDAAFENATYLVGVNMKDYWCVHTVEIMFLIDDIVESFLLQVESYCTQAFPNGLVSTAIIPTFFDISIIKNNTRLIQLLEFLQPIANIQNTAIDTAVLRTTIRKGDVHVGALISEYTLIVYGSDWCKPISFSPYNVILR
jgi:hypothetical protein